MRMKEIETKGMELIGENPLEGKKPAEGQAPVQLSDRLKHVLFNKRDEGYYFRKFQKERTAE